MASFRWTDREVRAALALDPVAGEGGRSFTRVSTDSRTAAEGDLFVALVGERFDGHRFVHEALAAGAAGAVVSHAPGEAAGRDTPVYVVDDTLEALAALAAHRRRALAAPVVGITGSAGKTTTKDLTAAALGHRRAVHATRGNLNNRIGLPLSLLEAPEEARAVVLEMGTNEPGEIAALTAVARPDLGAIVTVGESHLEKLGSVEGVLEEKLDLLRGLAPGGRCVVGDDPVRLGAAARRVHRHARVAGWSEAADPDLRPDGPVVDAQGRWSFGWRGERVALAIPGRHSVTDALLALAVAELLGVPAPEAARGVATVPPGGLRGEWRSVGRLSVLVDCYNANPPSVRAALDLLEARRASRRVAVLGTMLELGDASPRLHREVLDDALGRNLDLIVATGAFAEAVGSTRGGRIVSAPGWEAAYPELRAQLAGDEAVLLKASRGVAMEAMLALLESDFGSERTGPAGEEA